ncbi:MAG TPA: molybdenum cofactor biosynthesis protein MoaE [Candidatus Acidoferrum sp.]|nr:molybdenum cofactor biosynthesis protein MoaE [Candidatus Acidoferrum sp.]
MVVSAGVHKKGAFSLTDGLKSVKNKKAFGEAGAIAVFIGVVRGKAAKNGKVQKLILEAYEEKANEVLAGICNDLRKKPGIVDVQIHHLLGEFDVGEDLVYVLVAGSHRGSVFPVLEEAVDRYKSEAPIFKKELVITGKGKKSGYWVSEGAHT